MDRHSLLFGAVGALLGVGLTIITAAAAVNSQNDGLMRLMGMKTISMTSSMDGMSMDGMTTNLSGRSGDDFDRLFLEEMIAHHQGAIDMAKQAQKNAQHEDLKTLANDILTAQSKEIDMMQAWQDQWGYKIAPTMMSR